MGKSRGGISELPQGEWALVAYVARSLEGMSRLKNVNELNVGRPSVSP
jgi:hypothetical protein